MEAIAYVLNPKDIREAAVSYIATLLPGNTRNIYQSEIGQFVSWLDAQGRTDVTLDEVTPEDIAGFRDAEQSRGLSPASIRRKIFSLRALFSWASAQGMVAGNPAAQVKPPKVMTRPPTILSYEEAQRLIEAPDLRKPQGARDRAMLSVALHCGLRVSELCGLRKEDIAYEHFKYGKKNKPALVVEGKGSKVRVVPLNDEVLKDLEFWMSKRPEVDHDFLFVGKDGSPLEVPGFRYVLEKHRKKAGIDKAITPHTLRHSFATQLAQEGAQVDNIRRVLGHSHLNTTQRYLHSIESDYAEMLDVLAKKKRRGSPVFK